MGAAVATRMLTATAVPSGVELVYRIHNAVQKCVNGCMNATRSRRDDYQLEDHPLPPRFELVVFSCSSAGASRSAFEQLHNEPI